MRKSVTRAAALLILPFSWAHAEETVPVTVDNFIRAETDT